MRFNQAKQVSQCSQNSETEVKSFQDDWHLSSLFLLLRLDHETNLVNLNDRRNVLGCSPSIESTCYTSVLSVEPLNILVTDKVFDLIYLWWGCPIEVSPNILVIDRVFRFDFFVIPQSIVGLPNIAVVDRVLGFDLFVIGQSQCRTAKHRCCRQGFGFQVFCLWAF